MCGLFLALIPNFPRLSMRSWSCALVTKQLARPAQRRLHRAKEGVTKTIARSLCSWLWHCGCRDVVTEGWKTAGSCSPPAQIGKEAWLGVQSYPREENALGSDRFPEVQLRYPQ